MPSLDALLLYASMEMICSELCRPICLEVSIACEEDAWSLEATGERRLLSSVEQSEPFVLSGRMSKADGSCCLSQGFSDLHNVVYNGWLDRLGVWGLYGDSRLFRLVWDTTDND